MNTWDDLLNELNAPKPKEPKIKEPKEPKETSKQNPKFTANKDIAINNEINETEISKYLQLMEQFDNDLQKNNEEKEDMCCGQKMINNETSLCCKKCGLTKKRLNNTISFVSVTSDHSTMSNAAMSFKIVGKNSYKNSRNYMKTCVDYKQHRKNTNIRKLMNLNFQHEGKQLPKDVINRGSEIFNKIKMAGIVYRGQSRLGVLGACLYYACIEKGITKTPKEIASIMNISEKYLSAGDRNLQALNESDIINIPTMVRRSEDYIDQYLRCLGISLKFKQFCFDLINQAEKSNIHIQYDFRNTTKSVGVIFMLIQRIPKLKARISKEDVHKKCGPSISTFRDYYRVLMNNKTKLKNVFKRHHIPMPFIWKNIEKNKVNTKKDKPSKKVVKK